MVSPDSEIPQNRKASDQLSNNNENPDVQSFFVPINLSLAITYVKAGLPIYYKYEDDHHPYHGVDASEDGLRKLVSSLEERFSKDQVIPKIFIKNEDRHPNIIKIQETFKEEVRQALGKEEPDAKKAVQLLLSWSRDLINSLEETEDVSLLENILELTTFAIESFDKKMIDSLLAMMKEVDFNTSIHSASVMLLTINHLNYLEQEGISWNEDEGPQHSMVEVVEAAFLHDFGKTDVEDEIILKPGKLTEEEYEEVKTHSLKGYLLAKKLGLSKFIREVALLHHRKIDGSGYPDDATITSSESQVDQDDIHFIKNEEGDRKLFLSNVVQTISIIDAFEAAFSSDRVYKESVRTVAETLDDLKKNDVDKGLFSKVIFDNFVKSLGMQD